jgi:hypothetical protein
MTNRKAGVVLIMERGSKDIKYLNRLKRVAKEHNITVWSVDKRLEIQRR